MNNGEPDRTQEIFGEAMQVPPGRRAAFLDQACADQPDLRSSVEGLLRALDEAGSHGFFTSPTSAESAGDMLAPPRHDLSGTIGRYRLLEHLGEGGLGDVWTAEQTKPMRRTVALKILKPGMDSKEVLARFDIERQALALMDHPNVARVYDAGATDEGRPYFVMEHVAGLPLTDYCDTGRLRVRQRLELFVPICQAVQHAHTKGIIHRDLKPSNILVTLADGKPVPKVIDFGIAKATAAPLTDRTLHTEMGRLMGTPEYMSPEQAGTSGIDVDTRSDVYSLGVILYQLLTGTLPFEPQALRKADYSGLVRIIREMQPATPSGRLSTLGAEPVNRDDGPAPQEIAVRRDTEFAALQRQVKGELDWIVMKCLEKDRGRRYETVKGLASDVQRFLSGEPVVAAPPSRLYRFRKFARRNRVMVTAATMVVAALLAGTAGTTFGLLRAEQRRAESDAALQLAEQRRAEADAALQLAEERAEQTQQVSAFQAAMLSEIDVEDMGRGIKDRFREQVRAALERQYVGEFPDRRERTEEEIEAELAVFDERADAAHAVDVARQVMDEFVLARAADALEEGFADQPLVRAQLHNAIAGVYKQLQLYDAAEPHQRAALEIRQGELDDDHPALLTTIFNMAGLLHGQGKWAEAEPYARKALEGRRRVLGDEHRHTLSSLALLGTVLQARDNLAEAEACYLEALEGRRRVLGDEHPRTLSSINDVGFVLQARGELAEAESYYREGLEGCRRVLGDDKPLTLTLINNMGFVLQERGELDEAESYYREGLEGCRRVLGDNHSQTLCAIGNMASILKDQRNPGEAELYQREALEGCRRVLGDEHPLTLGSIRNMGHILYLQGKLAEAELYAREALERRRRVLGDDNPDTLVLIVNMGSVLWEQGRPAEAEPYYREVLEGRRRVLGDGHEDTLKSFNSLATLLHGLGELEEAESLFAEGAHAARSELGDHPLTALLEHHDAGVLRELGRLDEALDLAQTAIERYRAHPEWVTREAVCARRRYAAALRDAGRETEAFAVSWEGIQVERRLPGTTPARLASALARFAQDALAAGDRATLELAEQAARESLEIREAALPDDHPQAWLSYNSMSMLGDALVRQASEPSPAVEAQVDKLHEAEPLLLESAAWLTRNADRVPEQVRAERLRRALERVVELYEVWDTVVPDTGHDAQAAEWRAELDNLPGP